MSSVVKKLCPECHKASYSVQEGGEWLCPHCGEDLTDVDPVGKCPVAILDPDSPHWNTIRETVRGARMAPDTREDWEVYSQEGLDRGMVFVGYAYPEGRPAEWLCVAIYPRAIYEVPSPSRWWDTDSARCLYAKD